MQRTKIKDKIDQSKARKFIFKRPKDTHDKAKVDCGTNTVTERVHLSE